MNREINLKNVTEGVDRLRQFKLVHTGQIIAATYPNKKFISDKGVMVKDSWNARFGRYLKKNQLFLGVCEVSANKRINDDVGHPTHASYWNLLPNER